VRLHFFACEEPVEQQTRAAVRDFTGGASAELDQYEFRPPNAALLRIIIGRDAC